MTKSELKRKLMTQRIEAILGGDRKDFKRLNMFRDYVDIIRERIREGLYSQVNEDIFTTELLKQDDVKLHELHKIIKSGSGIRPLVS